MKTKILLVSTMAVIGMFFTSCAKRLDLVYLQDMQELKEYPVVQKYEAVIHRDDKLSIIVGAKDPELAIPFNIPGTAGYTVEPNGDIKTTSTNASVDKPGYLVDVNGDIDFPLLGKLHVEGLSRTQLTNLIKKEITDRELLKDPLVVVDFLNFKFTVLGEVGKVGTYEIKGDRITLIEALAMAGDLTNHSRLDRIGVIREYGNKRRITFHDIRSKDIFTSPCYYLQQNDIIYVEPAQAKATELDQRKTMVWSTVLSFVTTITSLLFVLVK